MYISIQIVLVIRNIHCKILNARVNFQQVQVANNLGNAPRLFFYNELTRVPRGDVGKPLVATHIVPNTRFRALQLARCV